jgi:DNA polymerase-3 subunit delta
MALYSRNRLAELLTICTQEPAGVYLFVGDRYLCRQAAEKLSAALLADGGTEHVLDGDEEDAASLAARLRSLSLFPGRQIYRVTDCRLFHSKKVARGLWNKVTAARDTGDDRDIRKRLAAFLAAAGLDPGNDEDNPAEFSPAEWKKTFSFAHPGGDLTWITPLLADLPPAGASAAKDQTELLQQALEKGVAQNSILFLLAEEVDKRKKFYKYLKKEQVIIDLGVEQGAGAKAQKAQKSVLVELINQTLAEMDKTMAPGVMDQLLERVGFYPVAVVMETEKLCLSLGERSRIEMEDLNALVGRTRQDALFELTGALGKRQLAGALVLCGRLLDNGIHPLAIIATLRNFARNLLLFRALQEQPGLGYSPTMPAQVFQRQCLPHLKENERWKKELNGHPYALYMQFQTAAAFPLEKLRQWPELILLAEMRLKGSPVEPETILHHLLHAMLS